MHILGIESSCDDTSVALLNSSPKGHVVICEKTASQIEVHKKYGGVVPEIAGRMHAEKIVPLIEEVLKDQPKPDVIAVTAGPGLITGLLVGVEAAKTLAYLWEIPLVALNHIEGHIHSVEINTQQPILFPALCLVVSGGHTELILMKDHGDYTIIGRTKDDAAGECFDKVAKLLGFEYPGGPQISKQAQNGTSTAIDFPRPMLNQDNFDFSFSGLKTSALYWLRDHDVPNNVRAISEEQTMWPPPGIQNQIIQQDSTLTKGVTTPRTLPSVRQASTHNDTVNLADFCASFEQAIIDVLIEKTLRAAKKFQPQTIILAGGVSANKKLRETLQTQVATHFKNLPVLLSTPGYAMDNGAMIAVAGYYHAQKKQFTSWEKITVDPNWKVDQPRTTQHP
jgi:N6-L-threonylcarbamoyladenine synthase